MDRVAVLFAVMFGAQQSSCESSSIGSVAAGLLAPCERTTDCAAGLSCASGACTPPDAARPPTVGADGAALTDGSAD